MRPTQGPAYIELGKTTRVLRARTGLSQEALGLKGGLHRNYVGAIERGEINPTYRILLKVTAALDLPLSEFFTLHETLTSAS